MPHVDSLHIGLGGAEFEGVRAAELIPEPALSAALCQRFRKDLLDTSLHFLDAIQIPEYPRIGVQWVGLVKTAGLILLRSGYTYPDVVSLLLNGVESGSCDLAARSKP